MAIERTDAELMGQLFELLAIGVGVACEALAAGMERPASTVEWLGWMGTQMALTARSPAFLSQARLTDEQRQLIERLLADAETITIDTPARGFKLSPPRPARTSQEL